METLIAWTKEGALVRQIDLVPVTCLRGLAGNSSVVGRGPETSPGLRPCRSGIRMFTVSEVAFI